MRPVFKVAAGMAALCLAAGNSHADAVDEIFADGFEYPAPTISKTFAPASVQAGSNSVLTITLDNMVSRTAAILSSDLVDNFPPGLVVATPSDAQTTCTNAVVSATAGGTSVTLEAGARVLAISTCTITVSVTSATVAIYTNTIAAGALQTNHGPNADSASADLEVISAGGCLQLLQDPGLETTNPGTLTNPSWSSFSFVYGTPICSISVCSGTSPHAGTYWAEFGAVGAAQTEEATLSQTVTIPSGNPRYLNFWMRIRVVGSGSTLFEVTMDGAQIAHYPEPAVAENAYSQRSIDVSSYADGAPHTVQFHYSSYATGTSTYDVDDMTLGCTPVP